MMTIKSWKLQANLYYNVIKPILPIEGPYSTHK